MKVAGRWRDPCNVVDNFHRECRRYCVYIHTKRRGAVGVITPRFLRASPRRSFWSLPGSSESGKATAAEDEESDEEDRNRVGWSTERGRRGLPWREVTAYRAKSHRPPEKKEREE